MSTLLLSQNHAASMPADDSEVRSTITVVNNEAPPSVASDLPDYNTAERDPDTEGGLTPRAVSDFVVPSERWVPEVGNANTDFSAPIDNQVSTSGTAAAREMSGRWGHGSARWSDATEPTIREGAAFNDTYFAANRPGIQDGTLDYMIPSRTPDDKSAQDQQVAANAAAHQAARAALYQRFLSDRTGL